jgi:hypothetical protein
MGLIENLYGSEDLTRREIWEKHPFTLFDPALRFLSYGEVKKAVAADNPSFFIDNVRNNFFPDKNDAEVRQATINAINRGVHTLNKMCKEHLPEYYNLLAIPTVADDYDALVSMRRAKSALIHASNGLHGKWHIPPARQVFYDANPKRLERDKALHKEKERSLFQAYNSVRAWGLGHFVLIIDEAPETDHSVYYRGLVTKWFDERFNFSNPQPTSYGAFKWDNNSGIPVYGTRISPIRDRAKIRDENGKIKYSSLLMKMFLSKEGLFPDGIYDAAGVEIVVRSEEDVSQMVDYFRTKIRCSGSLEKFEKVECSNPPYSATKFVIRAPVRLPDRPSDYTSTEQCSTITFPQGKYVRVPVEVQIRKVQDVNHTEYKRQQYMKAFPLWYPRQIYEPILAETG